MGKMKFEKLSQFISALEEGPLYDEDGVKYVLHLDDEIYHNLKVRMYDREENCVDYSAVLSYTQKIGLTHTFTRKPLPKKPQDKYLVWCCDDDDNFMKTVRFYDDENNRTFKPSDGKRKGAPYDNYEVIPKNPDTGLWDAPFEWANEAVKELED